MSASPAMAKKIEIWSVDRLIPYIANARTHSEEQIAKIAASILEFGFTNPILVDGNDGIIAGHCRLAAARKINLDNVPVVILDHLSDAQRRAYILADNKLALDSGWDEDLLSAELERLQEDKFDLDLIGFSDEELSDLLDDYDEGSASSEGLTDPDEIPEEPETPITKPGDVWLMGDVHYSCEDCGTQFSPEEAQKMNMECPCG
jgi:ParB-like chromosome segregation protein Spo0J